MSFRNSFVHYQFAAKLALFSWAFLNQVAKSKNMTISIPNNKHY